ncbi:MAG: ABC transporter permease [Burkholderiales bacterium]|nr:ABC transporter permease [Burkholderiales bacterium]MDE1927854.1 ABC transporter permease [Burkholderiales bacterium]
MATRAWQASAEAVLLPAGALAAALLAFGVFVWCGGTSPLQTWELLFSGAFGNAFSWQNTLQRAAPLMLTALAVALPARAGLTVIGGEGALVLGALGCAGLPYLVPLPGNVVGSALVLAAGALLGAAWVALAGLLRQWRGVNETISSLLLSYIAIALFKFFVEGPMRDPASLNKPSTRPLAEGLRIGAIAPDSLLGDVHWGLVMGLLACLAAGVWLHFTASGFALRVVGGNARAARLVGLPADRLIVAACALGGGCAGLAGAVEVAAVQTSANASVIAGLGYTGILVSFVARHDPWAIPPVALLFGGFAAAGSLLQRRLGLPDASVLVLQGFAFVFILAAEALRGRLFALRLPRLARPVLVAADGRRIG